MKNENKTHDLRHLVDFPSSDRQPPVPRTDSPWSITPGPTGGYPGAPGSFTSERMAYPGLNRAPDDDYPGSPGWLDRNK